MNPIKFKGHNIVFGESQPQYKPLPALKLENGQVITCWELSDEEVAAIVNNKQLFISQLTFNGPLQPLMAVTELSDLVEFTNLVICEVCEKESKELYQCERCGQMYCDNCGANFDQFSQIDYNCCKKCAERNKVC